jgi:hypothetical protein
VSVEPGAGQAGLLLATYSAVADYKGFKESLAEMNRDARMFGQLVLDGIRSNLGATNDQVIRAERRTMTPGRIHRVINRLEQLNEFGPKLSDREREKQMRRIARELRAIEYDLTPQEAEKLHENLVYENLPALPKPRPAEISPQRLGVLTEQRQLVDRGHLALESDKSLPMPKWEYHNTVTVPVSQGAGNETKYRL